MAFSEKIKLKVKKKAHYKCCVCQSYKFLHVHHIEPEEEGGPDTFDNAAPLCTDCHDTFGDNKRKRKWIREKRDFWYKFCEEKLYNEDVNQLGEMAEVIEKMKNDQEERMNKSERNIKFLHRNVQDLTKENQDLFYFY